MTKKFATGKWAIAICDRCGRQVPYKELFVQMINMQPSGLRVCDECVDEDHPQWQIGLMPVDDPQALENPRPDSFEDRLFLLGTENLEPLTTEDGQALEIENYTVDLSSLYIG